MLELNKTVLGIELGSTRIKAVLIDNYHRPVAQGSHEWASCLKDGIWTYSIDDIHKCLQMCFANLKKDVREKTGIKLTTVGAIGVSGMMHGYLPLDRNGRMLTEFRTWQNTITGQAAEELTNIFNFNIPQRWSIAHLYQAILNGEEHVRNIDYLTTLSGYIHLLLTGERVVGIGEASGMFPIDSDQMDYDKTMLDKFDALIGSRNIQWKIRDILPKVLVAGEVAGRLTEEGAKFLDPDGDLKPGILVAPCEGDAGTGMVATNSVRVKTGNVSAGTSIFAMVVTGQRLGVHREIDMVTTPDGPPVAMVHCNNCTSDINAWIGLFDEFASLMGFEVQKEELFSKLFQKALEGQADCAGLLNFNYLSGESITDLNYGRPLFVRLPDARLTLANFMRTHLLSSLATLKIGLDILTKEEGLTIEKLYAHGGFFKTPEVGQRMLSAAVGTPVSVMETAGEGGPYGMALLAAYMMWKDKCEKLPDYLDNKVFSHAKSVSLMASDADIEGFNRFFKRYKKALPLEQLATEVL